MTVDTAKGVLGGKARIHFGDVPLPGLAPRNVPTTVANWTLDSSTSLASLVFKDLPVSGAFTGAWVANGTGFDATLSIDIDALAKKSGVDAVVTGNFVSGPGGLLTVRARNGSGLQLQALEARFEQVSIMPRSIRIPTRRVGLEEVLLRWENGVAGDTWAGGATGLSSRFTGSVRRSRFAGDSPSSGAHSVGSA